MNEIMQITVRGDLGRVPDVAATVLAAVKTYDKQPESRQLFFDGFDVSWTTTAVVKKRRERHGAKKNS